MRSLFDEDSNKNILDRLNNLNENSTPLWGKMTVGQMLWHCQFPLKIAIENKKPVKKPNLLAKLFFKKAMYNDKPWRKNLPTAPALKATEPKSFENEFKILKQLISEFRSLKNRKEWNAHPMFGYFSSEQWGKVQYKHLDHHLRQFGV
ncbi:DUF1569 domain-containing protein [Abyssalbus ytuae]|uniref:DUF1569 domain-containing protein n=1 Tax=Abyssalbus ytuae TaxID=2926907 RepID=A0A9E6ZIW0_9FLAO|nr:DUF1569 domain-containing protein [Abyssalbus ytuae]UOB16364.1 DUF1569 domain-containing protein [Abyssalbus ytuae]